MMLRSLMATVCFIGLCCAYASADRLVLKDGQRLDGQVIEDGDTYIVQQGETKVTVKVEDVEEWIAGNTGPAAPLELKPVEPVTTETAAPEPTVEAEPTAKPVEEKIAPTGKPLGDDLDLFADPDEPAAKPGNMNASIERDQANPAVKRRIVQKTERAAAFAVASDLLVTSAKVAVGGKDAQLLTRDGDVVEFEVVRHDAQLALLRVKGRRLMALTLADSYVSAKVGGGEMRVCGFTDRDIFQPTLTAIPCRAESPANAKGVWTITADANPVSAGGPILFGNLVVGVQLATEKGKPDAIEAVTFDALKKFLGKDAGRPTVVEADPELGSLLLTAVHDRPVNTK